MKYLNTRLTDEKLWEHGNSLNKELLWILVWLMKYLNTRLSDEKLWEHGNSLNIELINAWV